jgi:hypothetical protein
MGWKGKVKGVRGNGWGYMRKMKGVIGALYKYTVLEDHLLCTVI